MEIIKYFFDCYFNMSAEYSELEDLVKEFIQIESKDYNNRFKKELTDVIDNEKWYRVTKIASKEGGVRLTTKKAEILIRYIKLIMDGKEPIEKPNFYSKK